MLKALFLDLDETLCDTTGANLKARDFIAKKASSMFSTDFSSDDFANDYLTGIYKILTDEMKKVLLPIDDEEVFRTDLLRYLFKKHNLPEVEDAIYHEFRTGFDDYRLQSFDFFPGVQSLLADLRKEYTLVVITNGPIYSQRPKVKKVDLRNQVDHVIIGGEEPEEKPYKSIFSKACKLANCQADEAIHVGDSLSADIAGASNANIKSVWISPEKKNDPLPNFIITNFIHIEAILQSID